MIKFILSMVMIFTLITKTKADPIFEYTYRGNTFTQVGNTDLNLLPYSYENRVTFSFIHNGVVSGLVEWQNILGWSMSDGTQSYTSNDGSGAYLFWEFSLYAEIPNRPSEWEIIVRRPCDGCAVIINTTNSGENVYDWGQNFTFNYAINFNNPGIWTFRPVPEPATLTLFATFLLLGAMIRRKSRASPLFR